MKRRALTLAVVGGSVFALWGLNRTLDWLLPSQSALNKAFDSIAAKADADDWAPIGARIADEAADARNEIKAHLRRFGHCSHRSAADRHYAVSCRRQAVRQQLCWQDYESAFPHGESIEEAMGRHCEVSPLKCPAYVRRFPEGKWIAVAEEAIFSECRMGNCDDYLGLFPAGNHARDARILQDRRRLKSEQAMAELQRLKHPDGPYSVVRLMLPPEADPQLLTVRLAGRTLSGLSYAGTGEYEVPESQRSLEVCYAARIAPKRGRCVDLDVHAGDNVVPLSRVKVTASRSYDVQCTFDEITLHSGSTIDVLFVMPGRHFTSCDVYGGAFADNVRNSVGHRYANGVGVAFESPPDGGTVSVNFVVDGVQFRPVVTCADLRGRETPCDPR
jgi:hypothetical protein